MAHPTDLVALAAAAASVTTGTAITGPLRLSARALEWLQSAVYDLSAPGSVH